MLAQHPHDITLPKFAKPEVKVSVTEKQEPSQIAQAWLDKFSSILSSGDASRIASIIHPDSWWRDFLALTWDFRTVRGAPKITEFLSKNISAGFSNLKLQDEGKAFAPSIQTPLEGLDWVESMFHFENKVGRGKGFLRLAQGEDGAWKAHFISTSLQELKDHEEVAGDKRPHGGKNSLKGGIIEGNWQERRERQKEFLDGEPDVFIIGAGKLALALGER